jgi:hypothetical protein
MKGVPAGAERAVLSTSCGRGAGTPRPNPGASNRNHDVNLAPAARMALLAVEGL